MDDVLERILSSIDIEENGLIQMIGAERSDYDISLSLVLRHGDDAESSWRVHCQNSFVSQLSLEASEYMWEYDDHVLLWPYSMKQGTLFFFNNEAPGEELLKRLFAKHKELIGKNYPFEHFLNVSMSITKLVHVNMGQLAQGPLKVLEAYKSVLDELNVGSNITNLEMPRHWMDGEWIDIDPPPKALVFSKSIIVAEAFGYERLP